MKLTTLCAGCLAGFSLSGVLLGFRSAASSPKGEGFGPSLPAAMTYSMWKNLLGRARTADEFNALAQYCQLRAAQYREKQTACATAMRNNSLSSPRSVPKHANRSQTLKALCDQYGGLAKHWDELGESLSAKAVGFQKSGLPR
jgi:hypothetical protein